MTGLTRAAAARIIAGHFDTQATHVGGGYDAYTIRDNRNRQWKVVSDASIRCRNGNNRSASRDYSVEFVSPICQYEDIETVQELVRKLRAGGAKEMCIRDRDEADCGTVPHGIYADFAVVFGTADFPRQYALGTRYYACSKRSAENRPAVRA